MSVRRVVIAVAIAAAAAVAAAPFVTSAVLASPSPAYAGPGLVGGGSSFAKLEIDQWRAEVARAPFNLGLTYVAQGSSFGRQQYIAGRVDFAASDIPFLPQELSALNSTARKDFAYVPVSAGGLGFMYNIIDQGGRRVTDLRLTRREVCRIFSEPNMMWTDAEIQATNPSIRLPAALIRPIVRQDGSGTSYVFSEFCIRAANDVWQRFVQLLRNDGSLDPAFKAGQPTSNWPTGWGVTASALAADGVAAVVADPVNGKNAITYNEAGFAKVRGFPNAWLQNAAGQFLQPTEEAVSVALAYARGRSDGTFELNYTAGDPKAYFPSTYSYVIAQTTGFPADKGEVLARFLCYAVTKGQRVDLTSKLGYARLSSVLVDIARNSIARIPGAPAWENCAVSGSGPPPTAATTLPPSQQSTVPATPAPAGTIGPPTATTAAPAGDTPGAVAGAGGETVAPGAAGGGGPGVSESTSGSGPPSSAGATEVPAGVVDAAGNCTDPDTGQPLDPAECATVGPAADSASGDAASAVAGAAGPVGAPAALNPGVGTEETRTNGNQIAWVVLQGAAVCGIGVALAGARKRAAR